MQSKCLDNLKKCKAECCRFIPTTVPNDYEENKDFYTTRGFKIGQAFVDGKGIDVMFIPSRCPKLTKNNRCSLWGKKIMPKACRDGYTKIKGLPMPENCAYRTPKKTETFINLS